MRSCIVAVACLHIAAVPIAAQQASDSRLSVGARVRVENVDTTQAGSRRTRGFLGRLVAQRADTLFVESRPGAPVRPIALSNVSGLWVSQGLGGRKTLRGLTIGAVLGGVLLGAVAAIDEAGCAEPLEGGISFGSDCTGVGPAFALGFGLGAVVGGVIGGAAGHSKRYERWERIR
jgi:hypothetical protein